MLFRSRLSLAVALFAFSPSLFAQDTREVRRGQSIEATLASDSDHRYTIDLDADTYVYGDVNQLTVDAVVTILGPDETQVAQFDSPNRGPEVFWFDAEEAGIYTIQVTPFQEQAGDYVFGLHKVERVARGARRVDQLMTPFDNDETPGAYVGVVRDGRLVLARGYGMANLQYGIEYDENTLSNIGSVTKQFTAMAILLLQNEGLLSLDDDIRDHIPEVPDFGHEITLKHLLNHTSGYREIYNLLPMTGYQGEDAIPAGMAIRIVQRQPELQALPNTEWNYNNTGYLLLAETIARASDTTFAEFMRMNVFEPLGMENTVVKTHQGQIIPRSSQGYVPAEGGSYRAVKDLAASAGAGGIYTTVGDLYRWMMNYKHMTLGGPEAIEAITTQAVLESGDSTGYGLGLGIGDLRGVTFYAHTGGDVAHRTYFGYAPELDGGVIISSNNANFPLNMAGEIAEAYFEEHFEPEEEETDASGAGMPEERMAAIPGNWRIVAPTATLDIVYTMEDGQLFAQATNQPQFEVNPTSDSTLAFVGVAATVTFHFNPDNTVDSATHHQGGNVPMIRVDDSAEEEVELTHDQLAAFTGSYYSDELEIRYDVHLAGDTLQITNLRIDDPIILTHQSGDAFQGSMWFVSSIEFHRAGNGRITGFMAGNGRTNDVWFRRAE